jgi:hypothetical protein
MYINCKNKRKKKSPENMERKKRNNNRYHFGPRGEERESIV